MKCESCLQDFDDFDILYYPPKGNLCPDCLHEEEMWVSPWGRGAYPERTKKMTQNVKYTLKISIMEERLEPPVEEQKEHQSWEVIDEEDVELIALDGLSRADAELLASQIVDDIYVVYRDENENVVPYYYGEDE